MKKCPTCGKNISEYASICPNCGFDLTKDTPAASGTITNSPIRKSSHVGKSYGKIMVLVLLAVLGLLVIGYISQPLHGADKIAYDLVSGSYTFRSAQNIEILSGSAGTHNGSGEKYACLTIAYTNSRGNRIVGHYYITEGKVVDIEKAMNEAQKKIKNPGVDGPESALVAQRASIDYSWYETFLTVSKISNELNYEKITEELNK